MIVSSLVNGAVRTPFYHLKKSHCGLFTNCSISFYNEPIIKNNVSLEELITPSMKNIDELKKLMKKSSYQEASKDLRKSPENERIQIALNKKNDWTDPQKLQHLIAARYLNSIEKGQAAQDLACLLSDTDKGDVQQKFNVPNYLAEAIEWICK